MNSPAPPRRLLRRFLQFRIRTMLILMTLVAVGMSIRHSYLQYHQEYTEQHVAATALAAKGVTLEWEPMRPEWLRKLLGHTMDEKILRDCVTVHGRLHRLRDDDLVHLEKLKHLKRLYLERNHITDEGLTHLSQLHSLHRLSLWGNGITNEGLRHLASLPALEVLDIHGIKRYAMAGLTISSGSRSIGKLQVNQVYNRALMGPVTPSCLEHLQSIRSLRALDFSFAVDEPALKRLASFPQLHVRTLVVRDVPPEGFAHLSRLRDLETLLLVQCELDEESIRHLATLRQLRNLELREVQFDGAAELGRLAGLEQLSVQQSPLGAGGFEGLGRLKRLKQLWLDGSSVTDADMAYLGGCTSLQLLDVSNEKLTADALDGLGSLNQLAELWIRPMQLDDDAVHSLAQMENLRRFGTPRQDRNFTFCLTGAGIADLARIQCVHGQSHEGRSRAASDMIRGMEIHIPPKANGFSDEDVAPLWEVPLCRYLSVTSSNLSFGCLCWKPDLIPYERVQIISPYPLAKGMIEPPAFDDGEVSLGPTGGIFRADAGLGPRMVEVRWQSPTSPLDLLERLPRMKRLTLVGRDRRETLDYDWDKLRDAPHLETLIVLPLHTGPIDVAGLHRISEMAGLRRLHCALPDNLSSEEFASLGNLTQLEDLHLALNGLSPEHMPTLGKLVKLKALTISGEPADFAGALGARHLVPLKQLSVLTLGGVSDEDLASLAEITSLTSLTLPYDRASDKAFRQLNRLVALKHLEFKPEVLPDRKRRIAAVLPGVTVK